MNYSETCKLIALVKTLAPAQKFEEFTAEAWHGVLDDVSYKDAADAVKAVGKRQAFIAPSDIIAESKIIRRGRLDRAAATFHPTTDDPVGYIAELKAHLKSLADGAPERAAPELTREIDVKLLERTFRSVPRQVSGSKVRL